MVNEIQARYHKKSDLASELMEVLSLNKDGVYRRLRFEKKLTADEVGLLARHYDISIDALLANQANKTYFNYNVYDKPVSSFKDYLSQINRQAIAFSQMPGAHLYYATREIPIFIYTIFPKLMTFKFYVYGLTTWRLSYLKGKPFDFNYLTEVDRELAMNISRLYCSFESTELWTISVLEQTLSQVEYTAAEGRFKRLEDAMEVIHEVENMIEYLKVISSRGKKSLPGIPAVEENGNYNLFYNELTSTNNTFLGVSKGWKGLFNTFDHPNFLFTSDRRLCESAFDWFKKVINHSASVSLQLEQGQVFFFERLKNRVELAKNRVTSTN